MKSGIKTSEAWVTIGAAIISILVASGVLTPDDAVNFDSALAESIQALEKLIGVAGPLFAAGVYTWSRTKIKTK